MRELTERALRAAAVVATRLGLDATPVSIHSGLSEIVRLDPHPIAARVMGGASLVRDGSRLNEGVGVAHYMERRGVPVVAPASTVDPGPHESDGMHMTLWDYVPAAGDGTAGPHQAGEALRWMHDAGIDCPVEVSAHTPMTEIRQLAVAVDHPDMDRVSDLLGAIPLPDLPRRWIHGAAHLGNVEVTDGAARWNGWEDCWFGPIAWDLACLSERKTVFGEIGAETDAALAAYGAYDADTVAAYLPLVTLWLAAWATAVAPDERSAARIEWVASRS